MFIDLDFVHFMDFYGLAMASCAVGFVPSSVWDNFMHNWILHFES
jgi:hypothetical protein